MQDKFETNAIPAFAGGEMVVLTRIGAAAIVLWLFAAAPASAACIKFEETKIGDAYLINSCAMMMNVSFCVKGKDSTIGCKRGFDRVPVAAKGRKLLWLGAKPPVAGTYEINLLSCPAPAHLVYELGSPPACLVDSADAG